MSGGRLDHAVTAFLRQEFGASVAAIIGFVDILLEDARRTRIWRNSFPISSGCATAAGQLSELIAEVADFSARSERA